MATKARMTLRLTKVFAVPVGRYIKIQTALRTHQIPGFVSVHSEKKINTPYTSCKVIFPSPEEVRNNTNNEQKFPPVLYVKPWYKGFSILLLLSVFSI